MEIYEITGYQKGISLEGVNYLQPSQSFQDIQNGYIYRQVLQSRKGFKKFSTGYLSAGHLPTRVMGIFENTLTATSSKETLIFDQNYAYKYNEGTNALDRIPFGGSLAAYGGFALTNNEDYISGTTYPSKTGANRFVFCSKGVGKIFFYDGTNILDFTDAAGASPDNPDFQQPSATLGNLTRAEHVFWFGERLNFVVPTLGGTRHPQGMLFSGIRNAAGNGDKFNVAGAGLLELDTYQHIKGAVNSGDWLFLNLDESNWMVEKTRNAFNPYFPRRVPGVLGTDASFSPVTWARQVKSIGRTGIIQCDGRQTLRIDNSIPNFTKKEIDPDEFEQTYGGFDRENSQFLWAYVDSDRGGTTQDQVLCYNYEEGSWSIYDQRFSCFGQSTNGQNLTWDDIDEDENPAWLRWDTTEETWNKIGRKTNTQKTLAGDDAGFVYELNQDFDDYFVNITGITKASLAVISTENQNLQVGDKVIISGVSGMTEINGSECFITSRTVNSITVTVVSTNFSNYTSGGNISKSIDFRAEMVPFNPYRSQGRKCFISHVEFLIDANGAHIFVDIFMDGELDAFKQDVLVQSTNSSKSREWISIAINHTADFMTFEIRQDSVSRQVRLTSTRIHCEAAELTTD